jgi:hypothetical protein
MQRLPNFAADAWIHALGRTPVIRATADIADKQSGRRDARRRHRGDAQFLHSKPLV